MCDWVAFQTGYLIFMFNFHILFHWPCSHSGKNATDFIRDWIVRSGETVLLKHELTRLFSVYYSCMAWKKIFWPVLIKIKIYWHSFLLGCHVPINLGTQTIFMQQRYIWYILDVIISWMWVKFLLYYTDFHGFFLHVWFLSFTFLLSLFFRKLKQI